MKLKLSRYPNHHGIRTEVNGVELPDVVDIRLDCPVDAIPRLTVTMNVGELEVEIDGVALDVRPVVLR